MWKIARALGVTFSALVAHHDQSTPRVLSSRTAKLLTNQDGSFTSRALFPFGRQRRTEFYELRLKEGGQEVATAHPPGTAETLVVTAGIALFVLFAWTPIVRAARRGRSVFGADVPYHYT